MSLEFDGKNALVDSLRAGNKEYDRRAAVIESLRAGHSAPDIIRWFGYTKTFVYEIKKAYDAAEDKDSFTPERKTHKRRSDSVRTEDFVANVKAKVDEDPTKSMNKIARELEVSETTVRRTIHQDLNLKSYVVKRRHLLTEDLKARRKTRAENLINDLKHFSAGMLRFFSDEKNFIQDKVVNRQNDRYLAESPEDVPIAMHSKYPAHIMVLGVVSSEGDVMPPFFFSNGLRLGAVDYIQILETTVKPWMEKVAQGRPYVFQQDSAPAHKARSTQAWLYDHVPHHWSPDLWPPSSPDCNPMDYFVWGELTRVVNSVSYNTKQDLKLAIVDAMANLNKNIVKKACSTFRHRLEAVVAANGGHIE